MEEKVTYIRELEKNGYMFRGDGEARLHGYGRWRRKITYLGEVEKKGYMSRGAGGERLHV